MSKIDFYILPTDNEADRLRFICRLIEKAYKNQHRIYVYTDTRELAYQLDELLWTYREDSFLPHNLYGEGPEPAPPIQIGFDVQPTSHRDILINLRASIPVFFTQFKRVCEVINNNTESQAKARDNYRLYRAEGHDITTHKLQTVEA